MSGAGWYHWVSPAMTLADLEAVRVFARGVLSSEGGDDVTEPVVLALDEVCANLVMHGYGEAAGGHVAIAIHVTPSEVRIVVEDRARAFHPDAAPPPDMSTEWRERQVGGLGWFLVRELMDEYTYESLDTGNRLTLVKRRDDERRAGMQPPSPPERHS